MAALEPDVNIAHLRKRLVAAVHQFFASRGYTEVKTPTLIPVPAQELHIDAVREGSLFYRTSPEFHMKRMLADGATQIYQIGPCWRAGEKGRLHAECFSMLEWYRVGADYLDIAAETQELVKYIATHGAGKPVASWDGIDIDVCGDWEILSVSEVFRKYAGWDPVESYDADRFDIDLVTVVEPRLRMERPVILKDYPSDAAAFARVKGVIAERWELYLGGVETANAYSELTDPDEQERRLADIACQRRALGKVVYQQDEAFLRSVRKGLPECAGVALGFDRLLMILAGAQSICDVIE